MSAKSHLNIVWDNQSYPLEFESSAVGYHWKGPKALTDQELRTKVQEIVHGAIGRSQIAASQLLVGDDRVAIPVHGDSSLILPLLNALIEELQIAGVKAEGFVILCDASELDAIKASIKPNIQVTAHNPTAIEERAYLASTQAGSRIYLNRHMLDTDVIIPLIAAEPHGEGPRKGYMQGLWPNFSDSETRIQLAEKFRKNRKQVLKEIQEVLWLGGFHLAVAVIPASGGVAALISERPGDIQKRVYPAVNTLWNCNAEESEADRLILSALGDSHSGIDIKSLSQVIKSAANFEHFKQVVLNLWIDANTLEALEGFVRGTPASPDNHLISCLKKLADIAVNQKVYILSNIPEELTDELNLIHLDSPKELGNLVNRSSAQWLIIENANRVRFIS